MNRPASAFRTITVPSPVSTADLEEIAARASYLWERLETWPQAIFPDSEAAEARIARWSQVAGRGDPGVLEKRLRWSGIDLLVARGMLGKPRWVPGQELPPWTRTVRDVMQITRDLRHLTTATAILDRDAPLPFEQLVLPAVITARTHLLAQHPPLSLVTGPALRSLERALLRRISEICADTFERELAQSMPFGNHFLSLIEEAPGTVGAHKHYDEFVQHQLDDGLREMFLRYPVLARHVATAVQFWVESVSEFLGRLHEDTAEISRVFAGDRNLGKVANIDAPISDPHNGGRSVFSLTFESGVRIVYKPKDVELERLFNELLGWCNERSSLPPLKVTAVLPRGEYGWVEHVEHLPCAIEKEAQHFYQQAGMLLCLLYSLRATDCHYENIIAHGAFPVLIDMETLLHHEPKLIDDSALAREEEGLAVRTFWDSVLRTGLLPRWEANPVTGVAVDISGLGRPNAQRLKTKVLQWRHVNTDDMRREEETFTLPIEKNAVCIGDDVLAASDYQADIVAGFEQMYQFILASRTELLAARGPLTAMREQQVRFIFRRTQTYSALLEAALSPDYLTDGADFSIELDHLSRAFLIANERPTAFPVLEAELRAMGQLDVPLFTASATVDELNLGTLPSIRDYFRSASFEDVRRQLLNFTAEDLARQVAIVKGSFDAKVALLESRTGGAWRAAPLTVLSSQEFLSAACDVGEDLKSRALIDADGSVNWIGLDYLSDAERFQLQTLNNSLCDGRGGVALFLAALSRETGDRKYADLARGALQPLRRQIDVLDVERQLLLGRLSGLGGATGLPSSIYCLAKAAQFLSDPALTRDALRLASWLTPQLIAADRQLDVMSGAAGALLALCAMYEVLPDWDILHLATSCAQHLILQQQAEPAAAPRGWKTRWERPLTGFSHGAAGISYALLRYYGLTSDRRALAAGREGIAYERSVYDPSQRNWPDFRSSAAEGSGQPAFVTRWCHGAPGVGLARVGSLRFCGDPVIAQDIESAMSTTAEYDLQAVDHLCCGNFGRIEALWAGARDLGRAEWRDVALLNATNVVKRARSAGAYQLFPNLPASVFNPGFLPGTAGIGYQLLRLANEELPSVLLWQ